MGERRGASAAIVALLIVALAACTPEAAPAPPPSPSVVSSEDAAFAAAEATYRAYVDAVNARRADPDSPLDPESFLAGPALESSRRAQRRFDSAGLRLEGSSRVIDISRSSASGSRLELLVCLDSSETRLLDRKGLEVTPPDRGDTGTLRVTVEWIDAASTITRSELSEESC
jgi:hypothetical protein